MPEVNHEILAWARKTAGLTLEEAVRKFGISDNRGMNAIAKLSTLENDYAKDKAKDDSLLLNDIFHSVRNGEIIEDYSNDKPYPSCLIYGKIDRKEPLHKEAQMRKLDEQCAICGGQLIEKKVEKLLKGGSNMASCKLAAVVCLHCGERFYLPETIEHFEKIELKLEQNKTQEFQPLGNSFQIASPQSMLSMSRGL